MRSIFSWLRYTILIKSLYIDLTLWRKRNSSNGKALAKRDFETPVSGSFPALANIAVLELNSALWAVEKCRIIVQLDSWT